MLIQTLGKEPAVSPQKTNHFLTFDELLFMELKPMNPSCSSHSPPIPFPWKKKKKRKGISYYPPKLHPKKQEYRLLQVRYQSTEPVEGRTWAKPMKKINTVWVLVLTLDVVRISCGCGPWGCPPSKTSIPAIRVILQLVNYHMLYIFVFCLHILSFGRNDQHWKMFSDHKAPIIQLFENRWLFHWSFLMVQTWIVQVSHWSGGP